jgi:hypothetical protein
MEKEYCSLQAAGRFQSPTEVPGKDEKEITFKLQKEVIRKIT